MEAVAKYREGFDRYEDALGSVRGAGEDGVLPGGGVAVIRAAAKRYGYRTAQVELRLYVGRFSTNADEAQVRQWARRQRVGAGPIVVHGLGDVVGIVRRMAVSRTYRDNPVLVTMKVLEAAGILSAP